MYWKTLTKKGDGHTLYLTTYDQSKAYDSASLERFNLPEKFIHYVLSIHSNIRATILTSRTV